jgi:hypothetical protein
MPSSFERKATRPGRVAARSTSKPGIVLARNASKFMPGGLYRLRDYPDPIYVVLDILEARRITPGRRSSTSSRLSTS